MDAQRWQKVKAMLDEVLDLEPGMWAAWLDKNCQDDALRRRVESLLTHHRNDDFLSAPALVVPPDTPDLVGKQLGDYRIVTALGRGGMGEVYEAEQIAPLRRTVAIKVMRVAELDADLAHRFGVEQNALATMNHPNVAQVFDADWLDDGRPYFVMELVRGASITEAVDANSLDIAERIGLFLQVCDGVQHAHRKGIIHRDLKPSNILVTQQSGRRRAKVIDFGVAKLAGTPRRALTADNKPPSTAHTHIGTWIGTWGYASPEQALGEADVDTRSDIYSLGALLYELLCGVAAFDEGQLREVDADERLRILSDVEPPPPSERCADAASAGTLRGDLDFIVARAMAKSADTRYATVSELAGDLNRYLTDRPLIDAPWGAAYRLGKLLRRRTLPVALSALAALGLTAGAVAAGMGYLNAQEARRAMALEAARAGVEARNARRIADFLADLFHRADPTRGPGGDLPVREILDRGAARIDRELSEQPAQQALLLDTIGVVYTNLGLYNDADRHLSRALALRESFHGQRHGDIADSLNHLGRLRYHQGQLDDAAQHYLRALEINRALPDNRAVATADTHNNLGELSIRQGNIETAIEHHRTALALRREHLNPNDRHIGMSLNNVAGALRRRGDLEQAESFYRQAIDINRQALGRRSSEVATNLSNLGVLMMSTGRYEDALNVHDEALAIRRDVLDPGHPHQANSLHNVGSLKVHLGLFEAAEPLVRESLGAHIALYGEQHVLTALSRNNLGVVFEQRNAPDAALLQYDLAIAIFKETVGDAHPYAAIAQTNLARLLSTGNHALLDPARAETLAAQSAEQLSKALGADHWRVAVARSVQAGALIELTRFDEAQTLLKSSLEVLSKAHSADSLYVRRTQRRLDHLDLARAEAGTP